MPEIAELVDLYRYPVKGLSPERLTQVQLAPSQPLPFDRAYAIENGTGKFDPSAPKYLPKINFLMLMRDEKLARLKTVFDDQTHELRIELAGEIVAKGMLNSPTGRQHIEQFMSEYMADELRGAPKIYSAPDHSFSDVSAKCVHIINLNSVRELEKQMGHAIDPLRFRANLVIDGPEPFSELDWVGQTLTTEFVKLDVFKRTQRCPATNVDPQKGLRDRAIPDFLFEQFGHRDFGVYAMVKNGGPINIGSQLIIRQ